MRPVASWSLGVVELADGTTVELPGFMAAARDDGLSLGLATATELKVQALRRYMTHETGRTLDAMPEPPPRAQDRSEDPSAWNLVGYFAGGISVWLLASWAAGTLTNPGLLAAGLVFALAQTLWRRAVGP